MAANVDMVGVAGFEPAAPCSQTLSLRAALEKHRVSMPHPPGGMGSVSTQAGLGSTKIEGYIKDNLESSRRRGDRFPPLELDLEAATCSRSRFRFRCVR